MAQTNTNTKTKNVEFQPSTRLVDNFVGSGLSYRQYAAINGIPKSTLWDMVKSEDVTIKKKTKQKTTQTQKTKSISNLVNELYNTVDDFQIGLDAYVAQGTSAIYSALDSLVNAVERNRNEK